LIGYIVPKNGKTGIKKEIIEFLQKKLPAYMIPAHFVELDKMPLTTSGKINRKFLPAPIFKSNYQFIAPVSIYEKKLADLWKEILNLDQISITDNFFESGGDSMLAVTLATKIQQTLNIQIDVIKVMEYPNIKALATYLAELRKPQKETTTKIEERVALRKSNPRFTRPRN
jgi:acyl carrier protein